MSFNRIRISTEATHRLSILKGRTGLTPNILCRFAFCYSLSDPIPPDTSKYNDGGQEFNRYTLTGEYDMLFISLLKERLINDGYDPEKDLLKFFKAHINRGVDMIYPRVKSLSDIQNIFPPLKGDCS